MTTLAENQKKKHFFKMRNNIGKHAKICNLKQQSWRREYLLFKNIFEVWKAKMADQSNCRIWQKFSTENIYKGYNFMKIERISEIKTSLIELN